MRSRALLRSRIALQAFSVIVFRERDRIRPRRRRCGILRSPADCCILLTGADDEAYAYVRLGIAGGTVYAVTGERCGN
jgi:hypothetical protein